MNSEWNPPVECSPRETQILKLCKKQKLWSFLRGQRHVLFDEEMRAELASMYASGSSRGGSPHPPERLALAMLLQVAFNVADHEVPTLTVVDRRWQMILDCLDAESPVFSQGSVFAFRERARANGFMDKLLQKTVRLARESGGFSAKRLRVLIDASPLTGAGRVEDTFNLLGRAIAQLVKVAAKEAGREPAQVAGELSLSVVAASSVKAALDVDWREPTARAEALQQLLVQFDRVVSWLKTQFSAAELARPPLNEAVELVNRIIEQDTEPDPDDPDGISKADQENGREAGGPTSRRRVLRIGTSKDRLISISDPDMRHGRKSTSRQVEGYKRHVALDADIQGLVLDVEARPANEQEHQAAEPLVSRIEARDHQVLELHIDRGYLSSPVVDRLLNAGGEVVTKPPKRTQGPRFSKYDFIISDNEGKRTLTCPNQVAIPYKGDGAEHYFSTAQCRTCPLRERCITPANRFGRKVKMHRNEMFLRQMHDELATSAGRARRRARTQVEHGLARIGQIQTRRARFWGLAKNQFDLVRTAVVANLYVLDRIMVDAA